MTIVFALGNQRQVVLTSDRRLTANGRVQNDESNKGGILTCLNGRFAFGFTGLGSVNAFRTLPWLLEALRECGPPDFQMGGILRRLAHKANDTFRAHPSLRFVKPEHKVLSVMFAGYLQTENGPQLACAFVTNFEDPVQRIQYPRRDEFMLYMLELRVMVEYVGNWAGIRQPDLDHFAGLLTERDPPWPVVSRMAREYLHDLADRPASGGLIGKQLTSIAISPNVSEPWAVVYHTDTVDPESVMPADVILLPRGSKLESNITLRSSPNEPPVAVPKVHMNARCPCDSGLLYKDCHGAPGAKSAMRVW